MRSGVSFRDRGLSVVSRRLGWDRANHRAGDQWFRAFNRNRTSGSTLHLSDQFQKLPDGGLIRSERMARLEAALLIADSALSARRLSQVARLIDAAEVRRLVEALNSAYDRERGAFRIEQTAGGFVIMTRASLAPWLDRLHQRQSQAKLSQPAMEALTIIAYQQPVTRADVEAIRGVQSGEMIRQLIERGVVRVGGEDDSLGRPFLYETTREFLSMFGLQQVDELPDFESLRRNRAGPILQPDAASLPQGTDDAAGSASSTEEATTQVDESPARPAA
jgi:segregation and condensation protein B